MDPPRWERGIRQWATGFSAPEVPAGTYFARVLAQNGGGTSAPSNEVVFTVAGVTAPGAPTLITPIVTGRTVALSWSTGSGGTPTHYTLSASLTPGGAAIVTVPLTGTDLLSGTEASGSLRVAGGDVAVLRTARGAEGGGRSRA